MSRFRNYHIHYGIVSITSYGSQSTDIGFLMDQFGMQRIKESIPYVDMQVLMLLR